MLRIPRNASGESSESSPATSVFPVLRRIDTIAKQLDGSQPKRRRGLSILEKYQICKKRIESKENETMKLEDFARFFPGMRKPLLFKLKKKMSTSFKKLKSCWYRSRNWKANIKVNPLKDPNRPRSLASSRCCCTRQLEKKGPEATISHSRRPCY